MVFTMSTLSPLLKVKVDELFLHWLSNPETQSQLKDDLKFIKTGNSQSSSPLSSKVKSNSCIAGVRPVSPPAPIPLSTTPPGKSPVSPRRRGSSSVSISSQTGNGNTRRSLKSKSKKAKKSEIVPGCAKNMPQFFFPFGKPAESKDLWKSRIKSTMQIFAQATDGKANCTHFADVVKVLNLPLYWKYPLFSACGGAKLGHASYQDLVKVWGRIISKYHDEASRLFKLIALDKDFIAKEDLPGLIQDVIETHPGLKFLMDSPDFHSRYVTTVISRIFHTINHSWSGRITLNEFKRSNFLQVLLSLEEEEDINQVLDYFSYEHFYVIYCKFWELDTDHDLIIDKKDLSRYNNGALSSRIINRVFSGCVTRGKELSEEKMSYSDFVWFLISEVDKKQIRSIQYWFRCMDLDGDGILSMYELEYFYEEQLDKMQQLGIEALSFPDCLCQTLDMVNPRVEGKITLQDLKRCKHVALFFDTFFNLDRWLEYEQRDPFQVARDESEFGSFSDLTDWEKYALQEYEILVNEEGAEQDGNYEDDFELDDDLDADDITALKGELNLGSSFSQVISNFDDSDDASTCC